MFLFLFLLIIVIVLFFNISSSVSFRCSFCSVVVNCSIFIHFLLCLFFVFLGFSSSSFVVLLVILFGGMIVFAKQSRNRRSSVDSCRYLRILSLLF